MSLSAMEEGEADCERAMLTCCLCQSALRDPTMLHCLHHACRSCVDKVIAAPGAVADVSGSAASNISDATVAAASQAATVKCFLCGDESAASLAFDNHFLSAVIRAREVERSSCDGDVSSVTCSLCTDVRRPADVVCPTCPATLCVECSAWHARLKKGHVVIRTATSGLRKALIVATIAALPPPECREHGKLAQFACAACPTPAACADCARSCVALRHEPLMRALSGHIAESRAASTRIALNTAAAELRLRLERSVAAAAAERSDRESFAAARDSALDALSRRRRALLDAANSAREHARRRLATGAQGDASRAIVGANVGRVEPGSAALASLLPLSERMLVAARYGEALLALPLRLPPPVGVVRVLSQRHRLAARIEELEAEDRARSRALAAAVDDDAAVGIKNVSPERVREVVECILGTSTIKTDDVASHGRNDLQLPEQKRQRQLLANSQDILLPVAPAAKTARFDASTLQTFSLAEKCYDVTVSADGTILAACGRAGLIEYDASSGRQVGTVWRAALDDGHDLVSCADALDDGRIAVGLILSGCIVLLSRRLDDRRQQRTPAHDEPTVQSKVGAATTATIKMMTPVGTQENARDNGASSSWREQETRIAWQQAAPMSLRAHGNDRLVVASGRLEKGGWSDGPLLTLIALRCGSGGDSLDDHRERLLFSKRLDYGIKRVAVTATAVVTAYQRRALIQEHGMECFDNSGNLLWRRSITEPALGLCAVPAAADTEGARTAASHECAPAQVYVSLPASGRVAAMDVGTGKIMVERVFDVAAELRRRRGGTSGSAPKLCNLSLPLAKASGEWAKGDSRSLLMASLCADNRTVATVSVILSDAAVASEM